MQVRAQELSKFEGMSLIVIDPVQGSRNASAAVSEERFTRLIKAVRTFVQRPLESSFEEVEFTKKELLKKR